MFIWLVVEELIGFCLLTTSVSLFRIILIQDLKIHLTFQDQFEVLENSRDRWMRIASCINIHCSLESLQVFFRLRFHQFFETKVLSVYQSILQSIFHQSILDASFYPRLLLRQLLLSTNLNLEGK